MEFLTEYSKHTLFCLAASVECQQHALALKHPPRINNTSGAERTSRSTRARLFPLSPPITNSHPASQAADKARRPPDHEYSDKVLIASTVTHPVSFEAGVDAAAASLIRSAQGRVSSAPRRRSWDARRRRQGHPSIFHPSRLIRGRRRRGGGNNVGRSLPPTPQTVHCPIPPCNL